MKRGVINLTKSEALEALNTAPETQQQSPLYSKLTNTQHQEGDETQLQISEEEAEVILDNLGFPIPEENEALKSMRRKVQEFLMNLRSN